MSPWTQCPLHSLDLASFLPIWGGLSGPWPGGRVGRWDPFLHTEKRSVSMTELCAMCTWGHQMGSGADRAGRGTLPLPTEPAAAPLRQEPTCCCDSDTPQRRWNSHWVEKRKTKTTAPPGTVKGGDSPQMISKVSTENSPIRHGKSPVMDPLMAT